MIDYAKDITMRHEEKFICSESYLRVLESRLRVALYEDENQGEDGYEIRSVYFDTESDRLYEEGVEGLEQRSKYRIRIYNGLTDTIKLEKKTSIRALKKKEVLMLDKSCVENILDGYELDKICEHTDEPLYQEFALLQRTERLKPKAIISYNRKAFVSDIGNIRITLDRNICVTDKVEEFFEDSAVYYPILPAGIHLLEVKYDGILPGYLARLINFKSLDRTSFSKYVLGRNVMKNNGRMNELYEF